MQLTALISRQELSKSSLQASDCAECFPAAGWSSSPAHRMLFLHVMPVLCDLGAAGVRKEVLKLFPLPWNRVDEGV